MKLRANYRCSNNKIIKRIKTEKQAPPIRSQQVSIRRLSSKIRLNDIGTQLLLSPSKYPNRSEEFEGIIAGWDNNNAEENEQECYGNIEASLAVKQNKKVEPKLLQKTIFKNHASVLLKKRYITERPIQNTTQILREEIAKKEQPIEIKIVKETPTPAKRFTPKSLYIKKINLVIKVKEQKDRASITRQSTKIKPLFFGSEESMRRQYKLPKLQRLSLDRQSIITRSKKISFPNHSLLRDQLSELNKLLSTQCVSIRQKLMS